MSRILIIEDDELLAYTIQDILDEAGFESGIAKSYEEALEADFKDSFSLYLIDIKLPTKSGLELLNELRESSIETPAIFLTSYKDKESVIKAFEIGADDYIKKPFDNDELVYRIQAVLKRSKSSKDTTKLSESVIYDFNKKAAIKDGEVVQLSRTSLELLELLIKNRNKIMSKEEIKESIWRSEEVSDNVIRVYINKLKKIPEDVEIENIKGVGYRLKK